MSRVLALTMMFTAALFGIPIIIDPPPRDSSAEARKMEDPRRKRRGPGGLDRTDEGLTVEEEAHCDGGLAVGQPAPATVLR